MCVCVSVHTCVLAMSSAIQQRHNSAEESHHVKPRVKGRVCVCVCVCVCDDCKHLRLLYVPQAVTGGVP